MTTELVLAELLCCDCVFCNSLVFYVTTFYFILWAVVSAGYPALLSSSYFERINDDDDDDEQPCPANVTTSRADVNRPTTCTASAASAGIDVDTRSTL